MGWPRQQQGDGGPAAAPRGACDQSGEGFGAASGISMVLLDKNGTLTRGHRGTDILWAMRTLSENVSSEQAARVEDASEHPWGDECGEATRARCH